MKRFKKLIIVVAMATQVTIGTAQSSLDTELRMNGKKTIEAFEWYREELQKGSVVVYRGYKRIGYGTIVSEDGYILTKASELIAPPAAEGEGVVPISIRVGEGELYEDVEFEGVDKDADIALIKIEAKGLKPVNFVPTDALKQGSWVVVNGATSREKRRHRVGIVSANTRYLAKDVRVVVGVGLKTEEDQLHITGVTDKSGAQDAGMVEGDIIKQVEGIKLSTRDELLDILREKIPGDKIKVQISRAGKTSELEVELMAKPESKRQQPLSRNDSMSGRFSKRRTAFGRILQIDVPMSERSCGGPVLNLEGNCIGVVVAYANRAEKFVIPSEEAQALYKKLKRSGE